MQSGAEGEGGEATEWNMDGWMDGWIISTMGVNEAEGEEISLLLFFELNHAVQGQASAPFRSKLTSHRN